ncbi:uncharacterized protein BDCG_16374 [Blastomyces dermatitidis ER-3]|uniref:Uncharacterized protein n=1 Tax=Ajellomyces dermatitidis (strain ER-3 / ATCC MYA-2586) TaxID=559297 RepID=A0ABX2VRN8_AJEDR|nr:uncharacterized protein BDCG_16374 [Blastomyces dermatitidis ER-3]OAS99892.1 hypothetical protein BDCG_16374 [Blastomyces dermatitidis ER-3]
MPDENMRLSDDDDADDDDAMYVFCRLLARYIIATCRKHTSRACNACTPYTYLLPPSHSFSRTQFNFTSSVLGDPSQHRTQRRDRERGQKSKKEGSHQPPNEAEPCTV